MKTWPKYLLGMFFVLALSLSAARPLAVWAEEKPTVAKESSSKDMHLESITLKGATLTVECFKVMLAGKENLVTITLHNNSELPLHFRSPTSLFLAPNFSVYLRDEMTNKTRFGNYQLEPPLMAKVREAMTLAPGKKIIATVNITRYFDISLESNEYQFRANAIVSYDESFEDMRGLRIAPVSFSVKVQPGESIVRGIIRPKKGVRNLSEI